LVNTYVVSFWNRTLQPAMQHISLSAPKV